MIYYLIMHFIEPIGLQYPNPFDEFDYGLVVNMVIEIAILTLTFWICKIIKYRLSATNIVFFVFPILYAIYYASVWGCIWIENIALALAASIGCLLIINIVLLIIIDKIFKPRKN